MGESAMCSLAGTNWEVPDELVCDFERRDLRGDAGAGIQLAPSVGQRFGDRVCFNRRRVRYGSVIYQHQPVKLRGGGFVLDQDSLKPLAPEHGGDGRTLDDALREARRGPTSKTNLKLALAAERIRAQLDAAGIAVVVKDPEPEPQPEAKRKARACCGR